MSVAVMLRPRSHRASTAWLSVALGIAFIALGLLTAPWLLRRYGTLAQSLLAPARIA